MNGREGTGAVVENRMRICVVGDDFVAGVGDSRGQGWVGRVASGTDYDPAPMFLSLAVPDESTAQLATRWQAEVERRTTPTAQTRMVLAPGAADVWRDVSIARSRLHLANILDIAIRAHIATMVVGPTPGQPEDNPAIAELNRAFEEVATRRSLHYVNLYDALVEHDQWLSDLSHGDGMHPGQAGYGLIAWLIIHSGWHEWLHQPPL